MSYLIMEGLGANSSFSISLEQILMSEQPYDDYMNKIEVIVTMDFEKFRSIMSRANPATINDLNRRLAITIQDKFDLEPYEVKTGIRTTTMIHNIWIASICYIENNFNEKCNGMFVSVQVPASNYLKAKEME